MIDIHTHWMISRSELAKRIKGKRCLSSAYKEEILSVFPDSTDPLPALVQRSLAFMNRMGITQSVLLPLDFAGAYNDLMMDVVRAAPRRFWAFGTVDILSKRAVDDLKAFKRLGLIGLKMYPTVGPYNDKIYFKVYQACEQFGLPVLFHTGFSMFKNALSEWTHPLTLDVVAVRYPRLKIIVAHTGYPHFHAAMDIGWRHENIYFDSCSGGIDAMAELVRMNFEHQCMKSISRWGSLKKRLIFGSDVFYPYLGIGPNPAQRFDFEGFFKIQLKTVRKIKQLQLIWKDFTVNNARRVLGLTSA